MLKRSSVEMTKEKCRRGRKYAIFYIIFFWKVLLVVLCQKIVLPFFFYVNDIGGETGISFYCCGVCGGVKTLYFKKIVLCIHFFFFCLTHRWVRWFPFCETHAKPSFFRVGGVGGDHFESER